MFNRNKAVDDDGWRRMEGLPGGGNQKNGVGEQRVSSKTSVGMG
jgi:hypothetical protein